MKEGKVNVADVSEEDIARGLKLLEQQRQQRAKAKERGYSATPEQKEKAALATKRRNARQQIMLTKAAAAGITVTDKEIDAHLATLKK